jgi:hypothetical protein
MLAIAAAANRITVKCCGPETLQPTRAESLPVSAGAPAHLLGRLIEAHPGCPLKSKIARPSHCPLKVPVPPPR